MVDDVAYVIGGYHVFADITVRAQFGPGTSVGSGHETWLTDGAPIPIPIDDHVQAVWRDSLIYVITGWSNNTNVAAVQIYDPALDQWSVGTPGPEQQPVQGIRSVRHDHRRYDLLLRWMHLLAQFPSTG